MIKKHYKIFIAILIVIILISSFIVYDIYFKNNIDYNNEGKSINVKYFNVPSNFPYIKSNYSVSSNYILNNKMSYLNSTIMHPLDYGCGIYFGLNIDLKNINSKYLYINIKSLDRPFPGITTYNDDIHNATVIKTTCSSNIYELKLNIINNNASLPDISIQHVNGINNYNLSVTVSLNNNFHNTFYINTVKETAIYGYVNETGATGPDSSINNTVYVYDLNNSKIYNVNITNGCYYFFTIPGNYYKFYYYNNTAMHPIKIYTPSGSVSILKATNKSFCTAIARNELS